MSIPSSVDTLTDPDFPYRSHTFDAEGGTMRYVDEGTGPAVVFVHGTPTWSYLWRHLVEDLSSSHRVVAPDNLGFGRSDKPSDIDYRPAAQAGRLRALVKHLGLRRFVLVVHDFGGPIGLPLALDPAGGVSGLVIFNTWMWSLRGTPAERVARLFSGRVGRFLYERLAFSPRVLLKAGFADRKKLTRVVHRAYLAPFSRPEDRHGTWVYARELLGSTDWYEGLWARRAALRRIPSLILWGMKDPAFGAEDLTRWQGALPEADVVRFPEAGHFVQEEAPEEAARAIRRFLGVTVRK